MNQTRPHQPQPEARPEPPLEVKPEAQPETKHESRPEAAAESRPAVERPAANREATGQKTGKDDEKKG